MSKSRKPPSAPAAYDGSPPVLVFADADAGLREGTEAVEAAGGRVAATLPVDEVGERLRRQPTIGAVYLDVRGEGGAGLGDALGLLHEEARQGRCRSVVVVPVPLIDLAAAQAWHPDVILLSRADAADRTEAMRQALAPRTAVLQDVHAGSPLGRLSAETARIARMLAALSSEERAPPGVPPATDSGASLTTSAPLRAALRTRRLRDRHFPAELFADPAWDMLLELAAARIENRRVTVTQLCDAAAVPATTALRWIKTLGDRGLFTRAADPQHGRRIFVALSDQAFASMRAYLAEAGAAGAGPLA